MADETLLKDKKILVVDDEPDVLETLEELLPMCRVVKAYTFEEAREHLETERFDMAILDIMGVSGYYLLGIANEKGIPAVMLTAHALSLDDTIRSYKEGAASFVPKDEIAHITTFLADILEAREKGKPFWWRWLRRLGAYYDEKFGPGWRKSDEKFWSKFLS